MLCQKNPWHLITGGPMGTTTCDKADEVRNTEMCFLFFGCLRSPWNMPFPRETLPLPLPPYLHFSFGMELTQQSYVFTLILMGCFMSKRLQENSYYPSR